MASPMTRLWVWCIRKIYPTIERECANMVAQEQLRDAITKLTSLREEQQKKLDSISNTVRISRAAGASTQSLHTQLKKSLILRKQIASTEQRSRLIEQQVEVFENTEFNKSIVESLRTSADAMKNMGLQRAVDDVDGVMDEIHETFGLANEMQTTLSNSLPYGESNDTDDELMRELELITRVRDTTHVHGPHLANDIVTVAGTEPTDSVQQESVQQESVQQESVQQESVQQDSVQQDSGYEDIAQVESENENVDGSDTHQPNTVQQPVVM
jgi:uncharacterized protein (UPF0335 family)